MITPRSLAANALILLLTFATPLFAHEAGKGRNGGWRVDAGKYHAELVVDGSTSVAVYLSDADDKPISAAGFKATAILVLNGKSTRIELTPAGGSKMTGTAPAPVPARVKGIVQLTAPSGETAQAKF